MDLQKNVEMANLFSVYGKLLTNRQQDIFVEYYFNNLSLAEISEDYNVSRQAVLDSLQKSEKQLVYYENTLLFNKKYLQLKQLIYKLESNKTQNKALVETLKKMLSEWEEV